MTTYRRAASVEEAVAAMAGGARPIAGGTDLVVGARQGKAPLPESLVGIHDIPGLDTIDTVNGLRLGTLVTHRAILEHETVRADYTALADASAVVGSHATRANGTIGGNVMNASPAMDTGAPLACFDATVTLRGADGEREVPVAELWTGPGTTAAHAGELLTAVHMRPPAGRVGSAYVRLQYRRQMEIAVVGAAAVVAIDGGTVTDVRVATAALSPVIGRVPAAEEALVGTAVSGGALADDAVAAAAEAAAAAATPISDVRGSAAYRTAMAGVITGRAIRTAVARAMGANIAVPASDSTFGS